MAGLHSGLFTSIYYPISGVKPGVPIWLLPWGDVHKGHPAHSAKEWKEWNERAKDMDGYLVGMGDYMNAWSASGQRIMKRATDELHEDEADEMDERNMVRVKEFYEDIKWMKGRLIGLIQGNHDFPLKSGMTGTQKLCEMMKCQYLGDSSWIWLSLQRGKQDSGSSSVSVDIFAHHGDGGTARLRGAGINMVSRSESIASCDIYLAGHTHQRGAVPAPRLFRPGNGALRQARQVNEGNDFTVKQRQQYFINTGCFQKGWEPGKRCLGAGSRLNPTSMGTIPISLTLIRETGDGMDLQDVRIEAVV